MRFIGEIEQWAAQLPSFSRGEAGSKIGSSQPILLTEVECGQKHLKMGRFSDFLNGKSFKKSKPYTAVKVVTRIPLPAQNSPQVYFDPPSPREKVAPAAL